MNDILKDGRQSERALEIQRGVGRYLASLSYTYLSELTLASGRRADMTAIGPKGEIWIIEIKSSVEDFRVDKKWPDYLDACDMFSFATHQGVSPDIFPETEGLLIADKYGASSLREAPVRKLSGATRKAVMLRASRLAAQRLHRAFDPNAGIPSL